MKREPDYLKWFYRITVPPIALCLLAVMLGYGCSPYSKQKTEYPLPPELKDCKIYNISDGNADLYVVVCPNATTSTSWSESCGKNCTKTTHVNLVRR
jgi:hypothetical protein